MPSKGQSGCAAAVSTTCAWGVSAGGDRSRSKARSGAGGRSGAKQPLPKMDKAEKTLLIHLPFFTDSAGLEGLCVRRPWSARKGC